MASFSPGNCGQASGDKRKKTGGSYQSGLGEEEKTKELFGALRPKFCGQNKKIKDKRQKTGGRKLMSGYRSFVARFRSQN